MSFPFLRMKLPEAATVLGVLSRRPSRLSVVTFLVGVLLGGQLSPVTATDNLERKWIYLPNGCYDNYVRFDYRSTLPTEFKSPISTARNTWNALVRELFFAKQTTDIRVWIDYQQLGGGNEYILAGTTLNTFPSWEVHHLTIDFNPYYDGQWYFGSALPVPNNKFDVRSVALHEWGHAVALKHSQAAADVMWGGGYGWGDTKRTLTTHDKDGIKFYYLPKTC